MGKIKAQTRMPVVRPAPDLPPPAGHNMPPDPLQEMLDGLVEQAVHPLTELSAMVNDQGPKVPEQLDKDSVSIAISLALQLKDLIDTIEIATAGNRKPLDDMSKLMRVNCEAWTDAAKTLMDGVRDKIATFMEQLPDRRVRTEYGELATMRDHWKVEVTEPDKVLAPYRSPDLALLKEAVAAGIRELPGVRIWNEPTLYLQLTNP